VCPAPVHFDEINALDLKPNQPRDIEFPKRTFGKDVKQRSFQPDWFNSFKWLHYDQTKDTAFCFTCIRALKKNMISSEKSETAFTETGYRNWKKALETNRGFSKHQCSTSHKEATERLITAPKTCKDIGELFDENVAKNKETNREMLLKILQNIRYLARQSLPLRGSWSEKEKCETNSNFRQLLLLRSEDDERLTAWLKQKTNRFDSPEIQNEMLEIMALNILRDIVKNIQLAEIFSILGDETGDISNTEQLVFCVRWVDDDLEVYEDFIGMHPLPNTTADEIVRVIKDILLRMNLRVENARGQCYDGAAAMSGPKSGVATQIKSLNGKCLYTHCYGHALNLAVGDVIKNIPRLNETFSTAYEICKLVKKSPKRNTKLDAIRESTENKSKSVHEFCPTRWTVRGEIMESFLNNYGELMELWKWSLQEVKETEMKARFDFIFCCCLGERILKQTDNLSKTLQRKDISAAEGQSLASQVVTVMKKSRNSEMYELFWERVLKWQTQLDVADPKLPRKRKMPDYFQNSSNLQDTYHFHDTPKDRYRQIYFEAFDRTINCIEQRFDQPDYKIYVDLQEVLLKSIRGKTWEDHLQSVCRFYAGDIDQSLARTQSDLLPTIPTSLGYDTQRFTIEDLISFFKRLDNSQKALLTQVVKIAKLILVMPATNAISERSFSALKRVKTYLRSTTTDSRLNNLLVIHIHKDAADKLDLKTVANEFIDKYDTRKNIFGHF